MWLPKLRCKAKYCHVELIYKNYDTTKLKTSTSTRINESNRHRHTPFDTFNLTHFANKHNACERKNRGGNNNAHLESDSIFYLRKLLLVQKQHDATHTIEANCRCTPDMLIILFSFPIWYWYDLIKCFTDN